MPYILKSDISKKLCSSVNYRRICVTKSKSIKRLFTKSITSNAFINSIPMIQWKKHDKYTRIHVFSIEKKYIRIEKNVSKICFNYLNQRNYLKILHIFIKNLEIPLNRGTIIIFLIKRNRRKTYCSVKSAVNIDIDCVSFQMTNCEAITASSQSHNLVSTFIIQGIQMFYVIT